MAGTQAREEETVSLVGFKARNHPQQKKNPKVDDRGTTAEIFDPLHERFNFTVDVAAAAHNTKLKRYFTEEDDGIRQSWAGERVWCNPPYSDIKPWVRKAWRSISQCEVIVMLLPANRTEQVWWQDYVEPYRDRGLGLSVEFIRGRLRFLKPGQTEIKPNERPPFGCCLLIWEGPVPNVLGKKKPSA